jgi:rSAM/selenodomain-associated transferase 2
VSDATLSVVIPTLDEQEAIANALRCTEAPGVERVVVDGGSSDGTPERAGALGAEVVLRSAPGRARQMEAGWRASSGEVVLFLHADTRLEAGWADAVRAALADDAVAGGAFRLRFESERPVYRIYEGGVALRCALGGAPYGDQALFARREVLEAWGGFAPVPIFVDLDLARAIRGAGRLVVLPLHASTSARRYERRGPLRAMLRNLVAIGAYLIALDRERVARWYRGAA